MFRKINAQRRRFYGEDPVVVPSAGDVTPPTDPAPSIVPGKTYDEAAVKLFVSREAEKWKKELSTVQEQMKVHQTKAVPAEVREALERQISELDAKLKTKDELAREREAAAAKTHAESLKALESARDEWQNRFHKMKLNNDVFSVVANDAYNPEDVVTILGSRLYLDEQYNTRAKMTGKDGKELDASIEEAIQLMKDNEARYGHLFKSTAKGGLGNKNAQQNANAGRLPDNMSDVAALLVEMRGKGKK